MSTWIYEYPTNSTVATKTFLLTTDVNEVGTRFIIKAADAEAISLGMRAGVLTWGVGSWIRFADYHWWLLSWDKIVPSLLWIIKVDYSILERCCSFVTSTDWVKAATHPQEMPGKLQNPAS